MIEPVQSEGLNACPVCSQTGCSVAYETVKSLTHETVILRDEPFAICMNANCEVVYYSEEQLMGQTDVKVPIWYKLGVEPKILCYCSGITEAAIDQAVAVSATEKVSDIMKLMPKAAKTDCLHNNPTGKCCHKTMEAYIKKRQMQNQETD